MRGWVRIRGGERTKKGGRWINMVRVHYILVLRCLHETHHYAQWKYTSKNFKRIYTCVILNRKYICIKVCNGTTEGEHTSFLWEPVIKLLYYAYKQLTGHLVEELWMFIYFYILLQSTSRNNVTVLCGWCHRANWFSFFISGDQPRPFEDTQVPLYISLFNVWYVFCHLSFNLYFKLLTLLFGFYNTICHSIKAWAAYILQFISWHQHIYCVLSMLQ